MATRPVTAAPLNNEVQKPVQDPLPPAKTYGDTNAKMKLTNSTHKAIQSITRADGYGDNLLQQVYDLPNGQVPANGTVNLGDDNEFGRGQAALVVTYVGGPQVTCTTVDKSFDPNDPNAQSVTVPLWQMTESSGGVKCTQSGGGGGGGKKGGYGNEGNGGGGGW